MPSLLSLVRAQAVPVATVQRALAHDRVHHAYLFDGPDGVGKELTAFGLAQALVCERRAPGGDDACGECGACVRVLPRAGEARPRHPDVVLLGRALYEPAQIGRRTPETQDISIDQVRTLVLARAAFPPHEGRARVYVVRSAEELSQSAANALLKTLEEPSQRTHFILLTARPDALLSTIRSRTQRVRFGALPESVVAELLAEKGVDLLRAKAVAALSEGSLSLAQSLADPEASEAREDFVRRALAAMRAPTMGPALEIGDEAKKDKDALPEKLTALAVHLAAEARRAPDTAEAERAAERFSQVLRTLRDLDRNAAAQLAVEAMFVRTR